MLRKTFMSKVMGKFKKTPNLKFMPLVKIS